MVPDIDALDQYPWAGHAVLMGNRSLQGQTTEEVLALFGDTLKTGCKAYRQFIHAGLNAPQHTNLSGGGKRRSLAMSPALDKDDIFDDRILGGGAFVENLLGVTGNPPEEIRLLTLDELILNVARHFDIARDALTHPDKNRHLARARAVICHLAMRHLGVKGKELSQRLAITSAGVSVAARRGAKIAQSHPQLVDLAYRSKS